MLHGTITRGTTPTIIFPLSTEIVPSNLIDFTISCRQKGKAIWIKRKGEFDKASVSSKAITVKLSQLDTLSFLPITDTVDIQIKGLTENKEVVILGRYSYRLEDVYDEEEMI
jgi:hypothetical protein